MELALSDGFQEMSFDEILLVDGGEWVWKEFAQSVVAVAVGGAIGGALGGSVVVPVIGSVPGYAAGGILGGLGGAAAYLVCGWW